MEKHYSYENTIKHEGGFSFLASHFLLLMMYYAMGRISRIGGTMETHAHYFVEVA